MKAQSLNYPAAFKSEVVDDYHGVKVPDPYRWLEDPDSEETREWVRRQNELCHMFIHSHPEWGRIRERLSGLWNYPRYSVPWKEGSRYFYYKNDGLQDQPVLFMKKSLEGDPVVVLNPNEFSDDGTLSLSRISFSKDGVFVAYGISSCGSDWQEIKIRDIDKRVDSDEVLQWSRGGGIAWKHDNLGFFYNRHPEPGTVPKDEENKHDKVYWHTLGTPQSQDRLVYERPDAIEYSFYPSVTEDGNYLTLSVHHAASSKNRFYYRHIDSDGDFTRLLDEADAYYNFIDNTGEIFYFETDNGANRGRVVALDTRDPAALKEIIPECADPIVFASLVHNVFVVTYLHHAHYILKLFNLDGSHREEITLPGIGTITALSGKRDQSELFFSYTSYLSPSDIYRYDFNDSSLSLFHGTELSFDSTPYETEQVFVTSKDGTIVPMFITHRKGLRLDGTNPAILYGYGGFARSITPSFSIPNIIWLEKGGIYAEVNLRGGAEYGEEWHRAGMREKKQNVFDDFIAAAQWLIEHKYTNPDKIAIRGASNGGLLVAASICQHPELFGAVICEVPVTDMLRFHKFTIGFYWIEEYGNAEENRDEFRYLYEYSPLQNIREGLSYPPMLVLTADCDDRVVSAHAKKFVAALQAASGTKNPVLLRVETKAGHGSGKPITKSILEQADIYTFLFKIFDLEIQSYEGVKE